MNYISGKFRQMKNNYFHSVMRKSFLIILISVSLIDISCKNNKTLNAPPAKPGGAPALQVEGWIIKASSISEIIEVSGSVLPNESTEIRSETSGRVVGLNIREGSIVQKGTLLVKLFDGDLQAELKKLLVQLQIAEKTEERQRELLEIGGISQQDYDLSLLQVKNLNADIELNKVNISKTAILAPYTGRIGLKNISPGAYISPLTLVTTISQVNQLKIEFNIPEKYSSQVRNGQEILFTIEGSPENYKANVIATESSVEANTRNLRIRAMVKENDKYLVPGTFAKVKMVLGRNEAALMIPTQAIIPQAREKKVVVFRGGKALFATVTTGVRDSSNVQVLTGLNVGDTIVTTGLLFVRPESSLQLSKIQ
jgi:membrane fusion protein, multidrug efflux system